MSSSSLSSVAEQDEQVFHVEIPLAIGICILYIVCSLGLKHYKHTYNKPFWIHESAISCIMGIILGWIIRTIFSQNINFNSNFFFYLVLPPIIFSAGYNLRKKRFFQYMHLILIFGILGTLCNFFFIALGAYYCGSYFTDFSLLYNNGHMPANAFSMTWYQSLLLSSVLAGSDEVSALSLIAIDDYPRLGALIFGEGVINDALSIVFFRTFLPVYEDERRRITILQETYNISYNDIIGKIIVQLACSLAIGLTIGLLNAYTLKNWLAFSTSYPIYQTSFVLLSGYFSYAIAEACQVSGILTLFITAVTLAHYSWYSLSKTAQIATKLSFASTADIAEGFAFAYVGLSVPMLSYLGQCHQL